MALIERKYFKVYTKATWAAETWTERPEIAVLEATRAAAPGLGVARFSLPYGSGKTETGAALTNGASLASLAGSYIQITLADDASGTNEYAIWTGYIPAQQYEPLGQKAAVKTANQILTAYTLDYLLGQSRIETSFIYDGTAVKEIQTLVDFNQRLSEGRLDGNRTAAEVEHESITTHVFEGRPSEAALWTVWDILVYAIQRLAPTTGPAFDFPILYYTTGLEPAEVVYLQSLKIAYSLEGKSLRQVLNELISLARGLTWHVYLSYTGAAEIHIWSVLEEEITLGGVTLPAHDATDRVTINVWTGQADSRITIDRDDVSLADRIRVRGARIKATATFVADLDVQELVPNWTAGAEAAYLAGANTEVNAAAYAALTEEAKALANDTYRATEWFTRVFTEFVVPDDWNWKVLDGVDEQPGDIVNIQWDPVLADFVLDEFDEPIQGEYWNGQKVFLPWLPFKEGWDYSGASPVDHYPTGREDKQRKIMVFAVNAEGAWCLLERTKHAPVIRVLEGQMGVSIRFNPQHLLAKNRWTGAEPSQYDDQDNYDVDAYGYDYTSLMVTAMVETDQHLSAEVVINAAAENERVITIEIPWAQLWTVTPGTIVDLDSTNTPVIYGGGYADLRDDREVVKQVMAAARAWYGRTKYRATYETTDFDQTATLGTMLVGLDIDGAGTHGACISAVTYRFGPSPRMVVQTAHAELDFAALAGAIAATAPGAAARTRTGTREMTAVRKEISDIKQNLAAVAKTVHPAVISGGSSEFILATVIRGLLDPDPAREDGPVEGYDQYILRLASDSYAAWATGTAYTADQQRTNDGLLYTCILDHNSAAASEPGTGESWETYWELSTETTALPAGQETVLGTAAGTYYDTAPDMRHFVPWFKAGSVVRLEERDGFYFFVDPCIRVVGLTDSTQSIRWNDTDDRMMGVYT